tara:strand:+ start:527 stop:2011 length:1485 start_codon:yes stop_codon:yes gene_type:complete
MKQIIKKFNNLVKGTILKVQNKTNNNFNISNFSKYLIGFVVAMFIYLFYLLIPLMYDKSWVQSSLERKLLNEFKINLSTSADISYRILPAPHFLIRDSKIIINKGEKKNSIAEIKNFKVFLSQAKFFDRDQMNINKIIIDNANFKLIKNNLKLLKNFRNTDFSEKKIKIINSKIFFKNNLKEVITIITIEKGGLFFDDKKLLNLFNLKGRIFNMPYKLNFLSNNKDKGYEEMNFSSKSLKLNIFNKTFAKKNDVTTGENIILFLNNKINTKYNIDKKLISFKSNGSRINNNQVDYNGLLTIDPFNFNMKIYLNNYKILKLLNNNSILTEFIRSKLLYSENINVNTSMFVNSKQNSSFFKKAKINFNVVSGKINFNKTIFENDDIASLEFNNSNLHSKGNNLVFNSDIIIVVKNSDRLFSFLNTKKSSRKKFKDVYINLEYDFLSNQIEFNKIKIDNNDVSDQFLNTAQEFKGINSKNLFKTIRLINELLSIYEG